MVASTTIKKVSITEADRPRPGTVCLDFDIENEGVLPQEIAIWIESLTGEFVGDDQSKFFVPASVFVSRLPDFQFLRKRFGNFPLVYGQFFESLVAHYKSDTDNLSAAISNPDIGLAPEIMIRDLKEAGFLRWDSQSQDQLRDIGRLAFLTNGANFSVPGAGKTNALLAVHTILKNKNPDLKLLVVCPKNAMISWDEEVNACFGDSHEVLRLQGTGRAISRNLSRGPQIAVISYQKLNGALNEVLTFLRNHKVHLVLDESHRIKAGQRSLQGSAALALADFAFRRDILSGTPMPQSFSDLEAQFRFLWPRRQLFPFSEIDPDDSNQIEQANKSIRPYFVRTTKGELGLPRPRIRHISVPMSVKQKHAWLLLKDETTRFLSRLNPDDKAELRKIGKSIMRLLQFCSDPELLLGSLSPTSRQGELFSQLESLVLETPSKLQVLDRLVDSIMKKPGEKVVIWSMFVGQIERIASRYESYGSTSIHGGIQTGVDDDLAFREARIKRFKSDPDCRVLVANPAACGEGISLHMAAHHAIYFDRSFNAAHFLQSIDRIHRRGLPKNVKTRIEILCLEGTVEEVVRDRLSDKIKRLQKLLDDDDLATMVYEPGDLKEYGEDDWFDPSDFASIMKSLK